MTRILLVMCLGLACSSSQKSNTELEFYPQCPAELECRLFGDCTQGAESVLGCNTSACGNDTTDVACLTQHCDSELSLCFFGTHTGSLSCAGLWKCYGDCSDSISCLSDCRKNAQNTAKTLFLDAELCTDHFVFTNCEESNASCDFDAANHCKTPLLTCLDDHGLTPNSDITAHCESASSPAKCEAHNLRILAACPTEDATQWTNYLSCQHEQKSCIEPVLSKVCQELKALTQG